MGRYFRIGVGAKWRLWAASPSVEVTWASADGGDLDFHENTNTISASLGLELGGWWLSDGRSDTKSRFCCCTLPF
jgi:hypothetical protein